MNYWVDKGVDGFRLDVINVISKDENQYYVDSSIKGHKVCANGPHVHEYIQEMNQKVFSRKELLTVGETPAVTIEDGKKYAPLDNSELCMIFQFELMDVDGGETNKWSDQRFVLKDLKQIMSRWQEGMYQKDWNSLFWNNHDQPRCVSRFGDTSTTLYHEKSAKMLAICLHMMQGTPYIYQGEELGMTNVPFKSLNDYRDIETYNSYKQLVEIEKKVAHEDMLRYMLKSSRDHARTPMQWNKGKNTGFSNQTSWIMVNPNYLTINTEDEIDNSNSIFYTYQKLIQLRKTYEIIILGKYELIMKDDENIFAYKRLYKDEEMIVYCNFSNQEVGYDTSILNGEKILIKNYEKHQKGTLKPYESIVFYQNSRA